MTANTKPIPDSSASAEEKLEYELACVYQAYKESKAQVEELEDIILKYQKTFGVIERELKGALR